MIKIDFNNTLYPDKLRKIKNPPKCIYAHGNIDILKDNGIAVIGTRNCSDYGRKWCEFFTKGLLEYNLVIVSGLAKGIDSIAHNTTIQYGGKTIAVLPSGFGNVYPKENLTLYKEIIDKNGLVISEYAPDIKADSKKFLERNRIVSGLSIGTLVVEAEYRSGTSVTAKITKEQGKQVFCIPGNLDSSKSVGTNKLIKDGANLVTNVTDITNKFAFLSKVGLPRVKNRRYESDDFLKLFSNIPISINELIKKTDMKINDVMAKITILELDGKIKRIIGNKFVKI